MAQYPHHQSLRLTNFTAFGAAEFEFSPSVNVLIGENGTGKTHVMKVLYEAQWQASRSTGSSQDALEVLFQVKNTDSLIRRNMSSAAVWGSYADNEWAYEILIGAHGGMMLSNLADKVARPVFIPAIDMMGHTRGFTEAYEEVRLDFDVTCRDIVNLLRLERNHDSLLDLGSPANLDEVLGGAIEHDNEGRYYLVTEHDRLPMPLVAEGLRKIATLSQLIKNGWLIPGTTLFWDEPEVNLNPLLMGEVVRAILALARSGVQVFLATHSYVILKELDLQAQPGDETAFFALEKSDAGTQVHRAEQLGDLQPNAILEQYASLYDRELTRSTGRNRRGERVA